MDVIDQLHSVKTGALSRRAFSRGLMAAGVGLLTLPATSRFANAATEDQGTYFTWGGYDVPEIFGQYQAKHGELPNFATFGGSEEGLTKMRAGFVVDVSHPCNSGIKRWIETGLFQPLDTSRLSHWNDVIPELYNVDGNVVDGKPYMAPFDWGTTSITYRSDLVELDGEESWGILWDEKLKGRIGMLASGGDAWWCGAIYAGVDFKDITSDAAFEKIGAAMRKQRPLVRVYTDDTTSLAQALAAGEIVATMSWAETAVSLQSEGVPVKYAKPKEGAVDLGLRGRDPQGCAEARPRLRHHRFPPQPGSRAVHHQRLWLRPLEPQGFRIDRCDPALRTRPQQGPRRSSRCRPLPAPAVAGVGDPHERGIRTDQGRVLILRTTSPLPSNLSAVARCSRREAGTLELIGNALVTGSGFENDGRSSS